MIAAFTSEDWIVGIRAQRRDHHSPCTSPASPRNASRLLIDRPYVAFVAKRGVPVSNSG